MKINFTTENERHKKLVMAICLMLDDCLQLSNEQATGTLLMTGETLRLLIINDDDFKNKLLELLKTKDTTLQAVIKAISNDFEKVH
jgi:hypothetical protein